MIQAYLIRAGFALAVVVACCVASCRHGQNMKQGEWDAAKVAEAEGQAKALEAAAKEIAKIDVTQQTIIQKVRHEITKEPVYRDCIVPATGVGLLNQAIAGQAEPSSSD